MAHSLRVRLVGIRGEIAGIRELTRHTDQEHFAANWAMKRAVEHALLIISEAAKHLPQALKSRRPEVPWAEIHGLGNLLRHEYRHIDPDILRSIITGRSTNWTKLRSSSRMRAIATAQVE